jgi:hypothetical protein
MSVTTYRGLDETRQLSESGRSHRVGHARESR